MDLSWQPQCVMLRIFTGEKNRLVLKWGSSIWESFHFRLWEFIFIKKLFFFAVVNGRVTVSFIYSILKQETFLIAYCLLWKENLWWSWWGWEYQKPLWFLHVAFRWTIISQEEIKLDVRTRINSSGFWSGSTVLYILVNVLASYGFI